MIDPVILLIIQLCLGLLFGFASWHKLSDLQGFTGVLNEYDLLPGSLNQILVWVVALSEAGCAIALVAGVEGAPLIACCLLIAYTCVIGLKLIQGRRDIDCGCSGPNRRQLLSGWLLVRNGTLIILTLLLLLPAQVRSLNWLDAIQVLGAVLTAMLLYSAVEQLLANHSHLASYDALLEHRWKLD